MKAILPVAGEGTRLRPHTHTRPKCLLEVGGQAILDHILDLLAPVGVDEAVLIVGYKGDVVRKHVEQHKRDDLRCTCVEQPAPLGLGHAVLQAAPVVGEAPCLIVYGDTLYDADVQAAVSLNMSAIGVKEVEKPDAYGVVFTDDQGRVTELKEKPKGLERGLAIVGVNVIRETGALMRFLQARLDEGRTGAKGEYQLTDAFMDLVESGEAMTTFPVANWFDCGNRQSLLDTNRHLLTQMPASHVPDGCAIIPPVRIDPSADVRECVLGPNVTVGPRARVRGAILRDTIVNPGAVVEGVHLRDSIIGHGASIRGQGAMVDLGDDAAAQLHGA